MPPKTVLFNLKCEEVFEFAVGSKNHIRYNAQGSLICFGGFGNLQGHIEIWHRPGLRRLGHFQAQSSSICEWSPDGVHLLTATVTPRLRVDNGFKVWTLQGRLLTEVTVVRLLPMTRIRGGSLCRLRASVRRVSKARCVFK